MKRDSESDKDEKNVKMETDDANEVTNDDDPVVAEFKVVVCQPSNSSALYRVQFPTRKINSFASNDIGVRFKKSVKMLEVKLKANTRSASFDTGKAKHLATMCSGNEPNAPDELLDETYVGRSFRSDALIHYAIGFFCNKVLHLCPLEGSLEMKRSIAYLNSQGKRSTAVEMDEQAESDSDMHSPSRVPIRVRFARPETEKQKKRREESAFHRSKIIEQDPWIPLQVHGKEDSETQEECSALINVPSTSGLTVEKVDSEQLIQEAIIGKKLEELDLSNCNQLISLRRIRYLPDVQQIRALVIKARVISTSDVTKYVSSSISRDLLISRLRDCAHLVSGVWVMKSEMLYKNESQATFRAARDLALALLSGGLNVRRSELQDAFGLSFNDITSILLTFGKPETSGKGRTWVLKVPPVDNFVTCKADLRIFLEEKRYWHKRWEEIHKYLQADSARFRRGSRVRRISSRVASGSAANVKRRATSSAKVVVID